MEPKERKIRCKNTTLKIEGKRWASKVFRDVLVCLGEKLGRETAQKLPRIRFFFFFWQNEGFWRLLLQKCDPLAMGAPCRATSQLADISNFGLIPIWFRMHVWRLRCLGSRTLKKLKIQRSDQKLWLWEAYWHTLYSFLDISIVLTPISTHE